MTLADLLAKYIYENYKHDVEKIAKRLSSLNPLDLLVLTILSHKTTSINTIKAYNNLKQTVEINAETLVKTPSETIEEAIKVSGLQKIKTIRIKNACKYILENFRGSLDFIKNMSTSEARSILLKIPGISYKTVDVILLFSFNRHVMPIDVHIARITFRTSLSDGRRDYEYIRRKIEKCFNKYDFKIIHLGLIEYGRKICRARKPKCSICIVKDYCRYYSSLVK